MQLLTLFACPLAVLSASVARRNYDLNTSRTHPVLMTFVPSNLNDERLIGIRDVLAFGQAPENPWHVALEVIDSTGELLQDLILPCRQGKYVKGTAMFAKNRGYVEFKRPPTQFVDDAISPVRQQLEVRRIDDTTGSVIADCVNNVDEVHLQYHESCVLKENGKVTVINEQGFTYRLKPVFTELKSTYFGG